MTTKKEAPATAGTIAEAIEIYSGANIARSLSHEQIFFDIQARSILRLRDEVMTEMMHIERAVSILVSDYIEALCNGDEDPLTVCQCLTDGLSQITSNAMRLTGSVAECQASIRATSGMLTDTQAMYSGNPSASLQEMAATLSDGDPCKEVR